MSVVDLIRSASGRAVSAPDVGWQPLLRSAGWGAGTALAGLLPVVLLIGFAVAGAPRADLGFGDGTSVGAALWLLLGGARLAVDDATIAVTPLLGFALLVAIAWEGARRAVTPGEGLWCRALAWWGGYAVVGIVAAVAATGPLRAVIPSLWLPLLLVPGLGLFAALAPTEALDAVRARAPRSVRLALPRALEGAGALLGVGSLLVVLALALHAGEAARLQHALGADGVGTTVLLLAQVLLLPNLGTWALSFAAGPGYTVSEQAATSWSVSEPSVLPVVPILAAHPEPGPMPWFTPLLALLPVLVGAFVAHRTLRSMSRLASSGTKAVAIGVAILLAAVLVGLLDALAGGSFGAARLSSVGAPAGLLTLALAGEMLLGAVVVLVRDVRRLR